MSFTEFSLSLGQYDVEYTHTEEYRSLLLDFSASYHLSRSLAADQLRPYL